LRDNRLRIIEGDKLVERGMDTVLHKSDLAHRLKKHFPMN
jgi:translation initiation factor IF-1